MFNSHKLLIYRLDDSIDSDHHQRSQWQAKQVCRLCDVKRQENYGSISYLLAIPLTAVVITEMIIRRTLAPLAKSEVEMAIDCCEPF